MLELFCLLFFVVDNFCCGWGGISYFIRPTVLGYVHIRKGPNTVGFVSNIQPFRDAIKLFTRGQYIPLFSNYLIYYFSPIFFLSFLVWLLVPHFSCFISFEINSIQTSDPSADVPDSPQPKTYCANT
jgi:NADH:ubiquinone oxidoreductase subunit H